MKTFQATQLRTGSASVYREVEATGRAQIHHRDRPEMILMTTELLHKLLSSKAQREVFKDMQA